MKGLGDFSLIGLVKEMLSAFEQFSGWESPYFQQFRKIETITDKDEVTTWTTEWEEVVKAHGRATDALWTEGKIPKRLHPDLPEKYNIHQYGIIKDVEKTTRRESEGKQLKEQMQADGTIEKGAMLAMDNFMGNKKARIQVDAPTKTGKGGTGKGGKPAESEPVMTEEEKLAQVARTEALSAVKKNAKAMGTLLTVVDKEVNLAKNNPSAKGMVDPLLTKIKKCDTSLRSAGKVLKDIEAKHAKDWDIVWPMQVMDVFAITLFASLALVIGAATVNPMSPKWGSPPIGPRSYLGPTYMQLSSWLLR